MPIVMSANVARTAITPMAKNISSLRIADRLGSALARRCGD
jgi:hypothetical protein